MYWYKGYWFMSGIINTQVSNLERTSRFCNNLYQVR